MNDTALPLHVGRDALAARNRASKLTEQRKGWSNSSGSLVAGPRGSQPLITITLSPEQQDSVGRSAYIITSYGVPIAWLDGEWQYNDARYTATTRRHQSLAHLVTR